MCGIPAYGLREFGLLSLDSPVRPWGDGFQPNMASFMRGLIVGGIYAKVIRNKKNGLFEKARAPDGCSVP